MGDTQRPPGSSRTGGWGGHAPEPQPPRPPPFPRPPLFPPFLRVAEDAGVRATQFFVRPPVHQRPATSAGQLADGDAIDFDRLANRQARLEIGILLTILAVI